MVKVAKRRKSLLGKVWYFIWEEDSLASWLVNIFLAFILVKFIIYPGLGLLLGTSYPVVAVISGSMTHDGLGFDEWWDSNGNWYTQNGITKEEFYEFSFSNGFNEGDIMVLWGTSPQNIKIGHVIVYEQHPDYPPIIHRVYTKENIDGQVILKTKGDHNNVPDSDNINGDKLLGRAVLKIPYLGWVKIGFTNIIKAFMFK
ncbi:MAG: signal peptidase I [Nanoarchaeota archaeon]|nr:signal peptidase I [Nanoarchaeota archaeon]MCG2718284.1 signal peptidase I [Nanoarchaeota archaeon]